MSITSSIGLISGIDFGAFIDATLAASSGGKTLLQNRIASLQAQQTAMLDINARLLNLKNSAAAFRNDNVFQSAQAQSTNEDVLTATVGDDAPIGTYQFIVKQLVANSQKLSRAFTDTDFTPAGLSSLSFEFGRGGVRTDTDLEVLNGGLGVDRGSITITDRSGATATVDLVDAVSVNEVVERINAAAINVSASVQGDQFVITDTSGGTGNLTVANAPGDSTATDLGIAGTVAGDTLTGTAVRTIGLLTPLSTLNDGNGVLIRDFVSDLNILARNGQSFDVDLGRIDAPLTDDTLLSDLNNGTGVTLTDLNTDADLRIITRDGNPAFDHNVNLTGVTTIGELKARIFTETDGQVQVDIAASGDRLVLTQLDGTAGEFVVQGAGPNGTQTAEDLGILKETGFPQLSFTGEAIPSSIAEPQVATIGDVIDRINNAENNAGRITAALGDDGVSIKLIDNTGGGGIIEVRSTTGNPYAARDLGLDGAGVAAVEFQGQRLVSALNSVLTRNLNGGAGFDGATTLDVTDRSGATATFNNLDQFDSLSTLVDELNSQATAQGVGLTFSVDGSGTSLLVEDTTGASASNLILTGDAATALGIEADVAEDAVNGTNLQLRYVSESSRLEDLNYGRGVGVGTFRITDGFGISAEINIGNDAGTLYDIIAEINSRGLSINARVNDNGDGLIIEQDPDETETPFVAIKVESVSGTTAADLNIIGEAEDVEGGFIDGTYEQTVALSTSDTLDEVVAKLNDAGLPISAAIINTGSSIAPYRLNISSTIGGSAGELFINSNGVDFGLTTLSRGRDAKVFFGSDTPENAFLITSASNTVEDIVQGLTIDLKRASDEAITITVDRDLETMKEAVNRFITNFNDSIGRINEYDYYNSDTEERGVLLGNSTVATVRSALYRLVNTRAEGVDTQYTLLSQIGIRVGSGGTLSLDDTKFDAALANDFEAVANLFDAYESAAQPAEEIAPGVTVSSGELDVSARGIGQIFDDLLDSLTNSLDGTLTVADQNFETQIGNAESRIEQIDERLEAQRARLEREFIVMEQTLAQLQEQGNSLLSLQSLFTTSSL
jgi:flagellar hook-associated protein 2